MSYQYGGTCYQTPLEANSAIAFDKSGQVTGSYVTGVGTVTDGSFEVVQYGGNGQRVGSVVVPSAPPPCALLDTSDGVAMAWMVGGVWIAVFAVRWLSKQIETERIHDDA